MLLDVSRLVWRAWRGGLPTGIDRACLAYVERFGARSQAVLQRGGVHLVLTPGASDHLFSLLNGTSVSKASLVWCLASATLTAARKPPARGMIYLNVGHTGLHEPTLTMWIRAQGLRAIYLIHDLIPILHPEYCRPGEAQKHRRRMENVLSSAAGIIGNSRATIDELKRFASAAMMKMPPAVASWISGQVPRRTANKIVGAHPYFVVLGTIEGRKNHRVLLQAWSRLVDRGNGIVPDLLIVGQRGWQADPVFRMLDHPAGFGGHVRELNSCSDDEVADLLSGARALLMPSFAEGFGLPVIEALQLGTPVIASDLPVFREIAGDIPRYENATDVGAWEEAVRQMMKDDREVKRQRSLMQNYRAPTWETHFAVVEPWLEELIAGDD